MEILAPTFLEYRAVRHMLPQAHARWTGVQLTRWPGPGEHSRVIICGLAGALAPDLPPGTILIPDRVGLVDGSFMHCDPALVEMLRTAARALRFQPETRPLLTAPSLIVGEDRHTWLRRGFVAADMETGLLTRWNVCAATIRVVLDSPAHGISADWLQPGSALLQPQLWREFSWLCRVAPRYALRAAHVLKIGLASAAGEVFFDKTLFSGRS